MLRSHQIGEKEIQVAISKVPYLERKSQGQETCSLKRRAVPLWSSSPCALARQNCLERHRAIIENIDADIILPRRFLEPPMRMAVEIDRALGHIVPGAERVVAEDKQASFEFDLAIGGDARPAFVFDRRLGIIVANDEGCLRPLRRPSSSVTRLAFFEMVILSHDTCCPGR